MSILNLVNCNASGNFGIASCNFNPGRIVGTILLPAGTFLTLPDVALQATLQALLVNNSRNSRALYIPYLIEFTNNTKKVVTVEQDGVDVPVFTPPYDFSWKLGAKAKTKCYHQQARKLNGQQNLYEPIYVTDTNQLIGTQTVDANGYPALAGVPLSVLRIDPWSPKTTKDDNMYPIQFVHTDALALNEYFYGVDNLGFNVANTLKAPLDVTLFNPGTVLNPGGTTLYISAKSSCGGTNLADVYGSVFNVVGAWVVKDTTANTTITPSAVTTSTQNGENYFKFTLPSGTTGHVYTVQMASISSLLALAGAGVYLANDSAVTYIF